MSLSDEERKIIIDLEIEKAHRLYQQKRMREESDYNCTYTQVPNIMHEHKLVARGEQLIIIKIMMMSQKIILHFQTNNEKRQFKSTC